ncbi:MAG: helix-hairpin-helix domain-containing protein, partial [Candidatus Paceibacteria bacterium]
MRNLEIAKILYEIAAYLEMEGVAFKPRAYERAAHSIESLEEDIAQVYKKGGISALGEIPGVGESIALKIEEFLKTGRIKYYEDLKKKYPVAIGEISQIEGVGPKMALKLYKKLKIKTIKDLEKAAKAGRIRKLEGFGPKSEENILKGIEFLRKSGGRFILGFVLPQIREIESRLAGLKEVQKAVVAGSVRRFKETVGDIDILVISKDPRPVMDFFVSMPEVINVYAKGDTKSMVKLKNGMDADLRVVPPESFGAALNYFTGSKEHNVALRELAIKKGLKLNEYGLFRGKKQIAGKTEEEIYKTLGLDYIPPELRENQGEIEAARVGKLPRLISYDDLKGDLQIQTDWTDGSNSIREMALEAGKLGYEYIAITDHTKSLAMTGGSDERKLLRQMAEIDKLNKALGGKPKILKGAEVNILKDGSLDIKNELLAKLDIVGIAVHSHFSMTREDMTRRIIRAMENPHVDILFHPT